MEIPNFKEYFMQIAETVASRSTCLRRQYGALLVDPASNRIVSSGYNGAPTGEPNCCDIGNCYREKLKIPHGEQYEKCVAIHAEQNAICQAGYDRANGCVLYLAGFENGKRLIKPEPCIMCARLIKNARIAAVLVRDEEGNIINLK